MGRYAAVCLAVALLLAGCVGGQGGPTASPDSGDAETTTEVETTTTGTESSAATTDAGPTPAGTGTSGSGESATAVNFYLSDEQNAMGDFAHLNVTVSEIGLQRAGGGWTTHEVDQRVVDLTRLRGANATRLGTVPVENGTYETVFVHVAEVNGTLTGGEQVRVKLPSRKLQIHRTFAVGANESVDYVFDISVFEAGKSGKYILKPVIGESGTDKEIESVDDERPDGEAEKGDAKDGDDDERDEKNEKGEDDEKAASDESAPEHETALNATLVGNVTRGGNATVSVTRNGTGVANATVSVNGAVAGNTGADGNLTLAVPDADELEVEVETENGSAELERTFRSERESDDESGGN
ncbi:MULTISPECIES: DUF4382 domain-containing protein [Halorussus]|uniref:DUF4382 domain-containing protein n=1 Tax=Halorussus TaxID=1070314 RepID=UPI000E211961|nr:MULTISPECIES: DUF4382 domain-containing protein [Halorussus]NHN60349.1 DUF4382 domain-containing protein [Halorussus sp. JP-T4]